MRIINLIIIQLLYIYLLFISSNPLMPLNISHKTMSFVVATTPKCCRILTPIPYQEPQS